jgi:hypothetical protein
MRSKVALLKGDVFESIMCEHCTHWSTWHHFTTFNACLEAEKKTSGPSYLDLDSGL